jgi:GTPase SAR1 family protein
MPQPLPHPSVTKILILGNTGVGKSFLCNVLLERKTFASKFSSTSVTSGVDIDIDMDCNQHARLIYNIPGLIESDEENIKRNKACIKEAFESHAELPTLILFVMVTVSGRPAPQDIAAFSAIGDFLKLEAKKRNAVLGIVVNKVEPDEHEDYGGYKAEVRRTIQKLCGVSVVYFCEKVQLADRDNFDCPSVLKLRGTLTSTMRDLQPAKLEIDPSAELELAEDKLAKKLEELKHAQKEIEDKHTAEMKAQSKEHMLAVEEIKNANQRAIEAAQQAHAAKLSEVIAELERNKKTIQEHKEELVQMRKDAERKDAAPPRGGITPELLFLAQLMDRQDNLQQHSIGQPMMMPGPAGMPNHDFGSGMSQGGHWGGQAMGSNSRQGTHAGPAGPGPMSWNAYQHAHAGSGMSRGSGPNSFSAGYKAYKASFK